MEDVIRRDILAVLQKVQPAFRKGDSTELNTLSNMTIHNSGIYQDQDSIAIAVVTYSLAKMCDRPRLCKLPPMFAFKDKVLSELKHAQSALQRNEEKHYRRHIKKIFQMVATFENKFGMYVTQVLHQSRVKKGGRVFEHGISAGRAAQLMGVSQWDLMSYVGATKMEPPRVPISIAVKVKTVRRLFSL